MRTEGTLSKWNDDRGFGFITTRDSGQQIFVHISAFPHSDRRPQLGEPLMFEIESGGDGKKRATAVNYQDTPNNRAPASPVKPGPASSSMRANLSDRPTANYRQKRTQRHPIFSIGGALMLVAIVAIATIVFHRIDVPTVLPTPLTSQSSSATSTPEISPESESPLHRSLPVVATVPTPTKTVVPTGVVSTSNFQCDGRTRCPQMTSCAEAEYFLAHCPGVEMDGNHDGEPCEQQWCH